MTLLVFSALIFSFCNTLSLENYYSNGIGQPPACYLTIIPQAQMGSETIAHEAQSRMGYWLRGHEDERNNNYCFSKIQLLGQKYRE